LVLLLLLSRGTEGIKSASVAVSPLEVHSSKYEGTLRGGFAIIEADVVGDAVVGRDGGEDGVGWNTSVEINEQDVAASSCEKTVVLSCWNYCAYRFIKLDGEIGGVCWFKSKDCVAIDVYEE